MQKTAEYDFDMIRRADHFLVSVFLGVGKYHTEKFDGLAAAARDQSGSPPRSTTDGAE